MIIQELFSLEGRIAIVTGGSRGLGRALAVGLAQAGAQVAIFARTEEAIDDTANEIEKVTGRAVLGIAGDITQERDVDRLFDAVHDRLGPVDILVANAAHLNRPRESTWETSLVTWEETVGITLTGTFLTCRRAATEMVERRSGKIICIASTSSVVASLGHAPYIAAKGGVLQLVRALALEAAPFGVNVNAIGPTTIRTEMAMASLNDPERYQAIVSQLPLGRPLDPEDLVGTCIFLASAASDMITGQLLLVDAGLTIY